MRKPNSDWANSVEPPLGTIGVLIRRNWLKLRSRKLLVFVIVASAIAAMSLPRISEPLRSLFSPKTLAPDLTRRKNVEGLVKLTPEQILASRIETAPAASGSLMRRTVAPAVVTADPDRIGRVAAKVAGTVAELRKRLGERVEKGEIVAVIDSREVAELRKASIWRQS